MVTKSVAPVVNDSHQQAIQILLELGFFSCQGATDLITSFPPSMPRDEVPALLREAIASANPKYPEEVALFKTALSFEQPDPDWLRPSPEQQYFYSVLAFRSEENGDLRVRYEPKAIN